MNHMLPNRMDYHLIYFKLLINIWIKLDQIYSKVSIIIKILDELFK